MHFIIDTFIKNNGINDKGIIDTYSNNTIINDTLIIDKEIIYKISFKLFGGY